MSKKIAIAALGAVIAMGIGAQSFAAASADHSKKLPKNMEKCYGIAKAGKNDCGGKSQACAGHSKADNAKDAFVAVPKGTCNKIVGGSTSEG